MESFTEEGALLVDTFGLRLLRYLTAAAEDELNRRLTGEGILGAAAEQALSPLILIATQAAAAAAMTNVPIRFQLDVVGQFQEALDMSLGAALRIQAGGDIRLSIPTHGLMRHLALMLRDVFPLMLLPDDPQFPGQIWASSAIFRHPARAAFEAEVGADPDLSRIFPPRLLPAAAVPPMVYRSTGAGSSTQVELLPDLLLGAAWTRARANNRDDLESVGQELAAVVDLVRRAARGEPCEVRVMAAFTGALPDGIDAIELPFGTLRPIAPHERALAPRSIEGTLSHTIGEGDTVVVSYAGDLVLDTTMPYQIEAIEQPSLSTVWPSRLRGFDDVQSNVDTIRLAALLTGSTEAPLTLIPTWRVTFDPLSFGPMVGWNDPRSLPGIAPRRLTPAAAGDLARMVAGIAAQRRSDFDVAVRRTISGMTTRGDPGDALVDLVIGWENLFGSQSELRFRISSAIAWALGADATERIDLQRKTSAVYDARSAILHGSAPTPEAIQDSLSLARQITIRLLRSLFTERPDVLARTSGSARSRALILGGTAD